MKTLRKAVQLYEEIGGDRSWEIQARCALGRAYLAQGRREEAIELLQETLTLMKPNPPTLFTPGHLLSAETLSTLEEACDDPQAFREFCRRFRREHPESFHPLFTKWHLETGEAFDFPQVLFQENFGGNFSSDWRWIDPFGDCSFDVRDGLEIRASNGRDLWYLNLSAPRILRLVCGDFIAQTVCLPISNGKPAIGGILLWKDEGNFLRLDTGTRGRYEISFSGCIGNEDIIIGRGRLPSERVSLRLERLGDHVRALCSPDGEEWFTVGDVDFQVEDPIEIGLHAIGAIDRTIYHGAYPKGTAIRFESFRLWGK